MFGPKSPRTDVRKIEVHVNTPTEFELGDTAADIKRRREVRDQKKKGAEKQQMEKRNRKIARGQKLCRCKLHRQMREWPSKKNREWRRGHDRHKKGHMTYIYLTDEEVIADFVKDDEELYNKTNKHFQEKAREDCLWERFASSY